MHFKNSLIYFLRTQHVQKIWRYIADIIVFIGGVRIASYLTYLGIEWGKIEPLNPTILCISRDYFSKDIVELRKRTNINYPCILGGYARFQQSWFPQEMQQQTFYQTYNGPQKDTAISKSTEYARQILKKASKVQKIDALMSANFDYWQDLGFKKVCKELGIPFLVLSREHITIPASFDIVTKWYKEANYKFDGTAIAVGGNTTAKLFKETPILDTANVWVTGLPRLDIWLEVKKDITLHQRPYITLLTYTEGYHADENFKEVVKLFTIESLKYRTSNVQFIVKCKNYDDKIEVLKILKAHDVSNLTFLYDVPLYEVLPYSRLIINCNSLAIVEAVMARSKVVVPAWGECYKEEKWVMCHPKDPIAARAVSFANNPRELTSLIRYSIEEQDELLANDAVHDFVNKYFYVPQNSTISQKVEEFIRFYLPK